MRMFLIILLAAGVLSDVGVQTPPPPIFDLVFGKPGVPVASGYPALAQAVPVTPVNPLNQTSMDSEDDDLLDDYIPGEADYDKFDLALTKRIASRSSENFMISPLGLKLSMAILDEAATGATQRELDQVLDFDRDKTMLRKKFFRILDSLHTKSSRYILNLGSRIYVGNQAEVSQRFASIALESYKTEIMNLDFSNPKVASRSINEWVANNTEGRITELVDEDDVAGAILFVINTLFFKGTWRYQFFPNDTRSDTFYVTPTLTKPTPFMTVKNKFYYAESQRFNAKILRMPYVGNRFASYIIVPETLTGLDLIINDMTGLRGELLKLREHLVDVTLPKFRFEYTSLLDEVLKDMGIRQAFEDVASFPGISRGQYLPQRLKVSKVLQRSGIEVNELGSVAYSATEISIVNKFGEDTVSNAVVVANRPFLFFIQDEITKQLLFMGRLTDPTISNVADKGTIKNVK